MTQIRIEFFADDEDARKILEAVTSVPAYTSARAEMEAHLYTVLARAAWREADRYRAVEKRAAKRAQT